MDPETPFLTIKIFANLAKISKEELMDSITDTILDKFPDAGTDESVIEALVLRWDK